MGRSYNWNNILVLPDDFRAFAWSAPMRDLAAKLDLSDVGLRKLLTSYGVAPPPQGYWNKVHAGKPVPTRPKAPPRRPGETGRLSVDARFAKVLSSAPALSSEGPFASALVPENLDELYAQELNAIGRAPDFVILGDTVSYHYEQIATGVHLVAQGAWFLATNPDVNVPTERGLHPACGAVAALIERATGRQPYFVGKPNPFMMRSALDRLGVRAADTILVGDRMDTDVVAGLESGLRTALVLTGATARADIDQFSFRPDCVLDRLADLDQTVTTA